MLPAVDAPPKSSLPRRARAALTAPVKIVVIEWLDAHTAGLDELSPDEIKTHLHFGYPTTSYGYLIQSDSDGVSLCTDVQDNQDGTVNYRAAHFTPRGMIVSEQVFEVPAPTKRGLSRKECAPRLADHSEAKPARSRRKSASPQPNVAPAGEPARKDSRRDALQDAAPVVRDATHES